MSYDRTAWEEARGRRLEEERNQRSLARARTGEYALAHQQGLEAVGLGPEATYQRSLERARTGEGALASDQGLKAVGLDSESKKLQTTGGGSMNPLTGGEQAPLTSQAVAPQPTAPGMEPFSYDELEPRAAGGPVKEGEGYLVGEDGPEAFIPNRSGRIVPNRNLYGGRSRRRQGLTAPEANVMAHQITAGATERYHAATNRTALLAAREKARSDERAAETKGKYDVASHEAAAQPQLINARMLNTEKEREHLKKLRDTRTTDYEKIIGDMDTNWPATVAKMEADYRAKTGQNMSPEQRSALVNADVKTRVDANRRLGTPQHGAMLAMGLPKEGEPVRPGQLIAHGYQPQSDGSWTKEATHELSGSKYIDKFIPGAEGVTRTQQMPQRNITQGPALYREGGRWYGVRSSAPQQVPPKVVTIDQALKPEAIAHYNKNAARLNLPQVTPDLLAQNREAAAWQVLNGINRINQSVGDYNSQKYLNAKTYVLGDEDTKKAVAAHSNWLNPNTAPPTAPAGTPPTETPDQIRQKTAMAEMAGSPAAQKEELGAIHGGGVGGVIQKADQWLSSQKYNPFRVQQAESAAPTATAPTPQAPAAVQPEIPAAPAAAVLTPEQYRQQHGGTARLQSLVNKPREAWTPAEAAEAGPNLQQSLVKSMLSNIFSASQQEYERRFPHLVGMTPVASAAAPAPAPAPSLANVRPAAPDWTTTQEGQKVIQREFPKEQVGWAPEANVPQKMDMQGGVRAFTPVLPVSKPESLPVIRPDDDF